MVVCALTTQVARAQGGSVAVYVEGPGAEAIRTELVRAVPPGITVLPPARVADAVAGQGGVGHVANNADRAALAAKLHRVERALDADAVVAGSIVARRKGDPELHLVVTTASTDGARVDETVVLNRNRARAAQWRHLVGEPLAALPARGSVPPSTSPAPGDAAQRVALPATQVSAPPPTSLDPPPRPSTSSPETALAVGFLGLDFGARQFHYNERITNATLRPYDLPRGPLLPVAPGGRVSAEVYPLAKADLGVLRDLGVAGVFRTNFARAQIGETTISTRWYAWDAALRLRLHTGTRGASAVVGIKVGLGQETFHFRDAGVWENILPDVSYRYLRGAADARVPLGPVSLLLALGYRSVLSSTGPDGNRIPAAGKLGERFPQATIAGLDLQAGAALALTPWLEARVLVDYTRFWADLRPTVGSNYVAGGAVEQTLHAAVGVAASY